MRKRKRELWLLGAILFLISALSASASSGEAGSAFVISRPPRPPVRIIPPAHALLPERALVLPPLKAVLLVGPIDGNDGSWTRQEVANMELAAAVLEAHGVAVYRFYPGTGSFEEIEAAANGAHFLLYRGHGVYYSDPPYPNVGGFALSSGWYSPDRIRQYLHLAPNAIVMLYGCFTAGSSGADWDQYDIGIGEAGRRVAQYSDPFFEVGASGYYANWFGNAFEWFLSELFAGQTLGQAYESYFDFNPDTVYRTMHPNHAAMSMWIDKDNWGGYWQYNNAFAGEPEQTLEDLFVVTAMQLSRQAVSAMVEPAFPPRSYDVVVESSTTETFGWTATVTPEGLDWLNVTPSSGSSGEQMSITLTPTDLAIGTYQAGIRVVADNPLIENRDQTVAVTMYVVDQVHSTYLPLASK
jgi:hypothetical protein